MYSSYRAWSSGSASIRSKPTVAASIHNGQSWNSAHVTVNF